MEDKLEELLPLDSTFFVLIKLGFLGELRADLGALPVLVPLRLNLPPSPRDKGVLPEDEGAGLDGFKSLAEFSFCLRAKALLGLVEGRILDLLEEEGEGSWIVRGSTSEQVSSENDSSKAADLGDKTLLPLEGLLPTALKGS